MSQLKGAVERSVIWSPIINIGPLKGGKFECEFNNATAENKFVYYFKTKYANTYLAIKVRSFHLCNNQSLFFIKAGFH